MVESNSIKHNPTDTSNLNNQQFRPSKSAKLKTTLLHRLKKKN